MYKKIIAAIGVMFGLCFGFNIFIKATYAEDTGGCSSGIIRKYNNRSMRDACAYCAQSPGFRWGAAWISEAGSDYQSHVINAGARSVVNIEVRGLYYQCGHSGGSGNDMASDDVFLTSEEGSHERV